MGGLGGKEFAHNAGDRGSNPVWGRSPGETNGNPFQYSCLENPMDREAWWASVQSITESDTTEVTYHALMVPKYELVFPPRHVCIPEFCPVTWQ